jgi:hypothetical protein
MFLLKKYNFSQNLDLLPWIQKNLLPSEIKESTCEREGELKIKFEKERMRAIESKMENLKKKKKLDRKKKTGEGEEQLWRGRGVREREILKKKYEEGEEQFRVRENLKKWKMRTEEEEWERARAWGRGLEAI